MGSGATKLLTYDDAVTRFPPADLERIEAAFRDLSQNTGEPAYLSYASFKRDVFANFLPDRLASRLYSLFTNSSRSGMSYKDLICCLGLIFYGSQKERMHLLYAIFAQGGTLYWQDVASLLAQCNDRLPQSRDLPINYNGVVTQEQFLAWLAHHQGHTTTITDWLLDDQRLYELLTYASEKTYDQYSILAGVTHLSEKEIKELERTYQQLSTLKSNNRQQQIGFATFAALVSPALPTILTEGFFEAFDENQDGCIDFKEFVCGISAACRGPQFARYKFLLRVFDRDHDGELNRCDLLYMTSCLIDLSPFINASIDYANQSADLYVDQILAKDNSSPTSSLRLDEFLTWCQTDRLIYELTDLIFQICHVILGLRPLCQQDEITIVKHFLRREKAPFFETQFDPVKPISNIPRPTSKPGAIWFLIPMAWWTRWEVAFASPNVLVIEGTNSSVKKKASSNKPNKSDQRGQDLGDIDSSSLIEKIISIDCVQLKPNLREGIHFQMIPEVLWLFLHKYYRCQGPIVSRKVIYRQRTYQPELDLYPLLIKVYRNQPISSQQTRGPSPDTSANQPSSNSYTYPLLNYVSATMFGSSSPSPTAVTHTSRHYLVCSYFVSLYQTIRSLAEELSHQFGKSLDEIRLWMRINENDLRPIDFESIDDYNCLEAGFNRSSEILLEIRNADLTWPEELHTLATRAKATLAGAEASSTSLVSNDKLKQGQIGLSNLGNTCFLNAAVQCLSHSFALTFYFTQKYHLFEINKENPIGMQGNVALRYGQLVEKLWSNVRGPLAPFELRGSVAKFGSSRFTDFQQHDSQEFLAFLLDGLHEDLNRVHEKPYVELKDSDDRTDEDVAQEYWSNHLARNTSIIVDLFHGLLRSQVQCRTCQLKSVRFDPFNILSLPLPIDNSIYIEVKLIRLDGSKPTRYGMKIDGDLTVDHIKQQLASLASLSIEQIEFFDTASSPFLRRQPLLDSKQTRVKQLNLREFLAYEIPLVKPKEETDDSEKTVSAPYLIAIHRRLERQDRYLSPVTSDKIRLFGQPILVPYLRESSRKITNLDIYAALSQQFERLLRRPSRHNSVSNHAMDCDDSLKQKYPFVLKHVTADGRQCSICPWNRFCSGCKFVSNDTEFYYSGPYIAIEWNSSAYYLRYLPGHEQDVDIHASVHLGRTRNPSDVTGDYPIAKVQLEDCLQSFTTWENLDQKEMFHCKRCKQLQPADKKLDIWKLPPCLIFHIKRFQLSGNRWVKSSRAVHFPVRSFRPSKYLPQRSSASPPVDKHRSDSSSSSSATASFSSLTTTTTTMTRTDEMSLLSVPDPLPSSASCSTDEENPASAVLTVSESPDDMMQTTNASLKRSSKEEVLPNGHLSIPYPPRFSQMDERTFSFGDNSFDVDNASYNLYALVCHYGVIGGGHYVAFVRNHTDKQWYCFNDSSCKPVSESLIEQCSSSAYLLFYEREGLDHRCYMPNVVGKKPIADELPLNNDDRWCSLM